MRNYLIIAVFFLCLSIKGQENKFSIFSDFPGGNIQVNCISNDTVYLQPDYRDTEGNWFYWYFKIRNAQGKRLVFNFGSIHGSYSNAIGRFGPLCSTDKEKSWNWLTDFNNYSNIFYYQFSEKDSLVSFSISYPYTEKNFQFFIKPYLSNKLVYLNTLCVSNKGRNIEYLTIKNPSINSKKKVFITARHHACEVSANLVMEGFIDGIINLQENQWLRDSVEFIFVPFVDKDGVEKGDQGKYRKPHDHNRDYNDGIYNSTIAIRQKILSWNDAKVIVAIDMHAPLITYGGNEVLFIVGSNDSINEKEQLHFSEILTLINKSELPYNTKNFIPFGASWNINSSYKGLSFINWSQQQPKVKLAFTIEVPYANVSGVNLTKEKAQDFGRYLSLALAYYLKEK